MMQSRRAFLMGATSLVAATAGRVVFGPQTASVTSPEYSWPWQSMTPDQILAKLQLMFERALTESIAFSVDQETGQITANGPTRSKIDELMGVHHG